jgi:hypothetical protein
MECQYSLITFGIAKQVLSVDGSGELKPDIVNHFFEKRTSIEAARKEEALGRIEYPSPRDVLLGRGKPYQEYWGNLLLGNFIDTRRDQYNKASRFEKTCISMDMVKVLQESGGRFIQRNETTGGWVEVEDPVAREKVSSGFRTKTKRDINIPLSDWRAHGIEEPNEDQQRQKRPKVVPEEGLRLHSQSIWLETFT